MKLKQSLARAREELAGIEDASLEAELLLRQALEIGRVQLYQRLEDELSQQQEADFWRLVERRRRGEPSAYITGHRQFYGLDFEVNPAVLIPRPESELLVEMAFRRARAGNIATIADIGTGCGAIAISLAVSLPRVTVYATDISAAALEVARANCRRHRVAERVIFLKGDLLAPLPAPVDMIIANLPYVREADLPPGGFEPPLALDGGPDGLRQLARLCRQAGGRLRPAGCLLLEVGQGQAGAVEALLRRLSPQAQIGVFPDLGGIPRVVELSLTQAGLDAKLSRASPAKTPD